jgi:acyl transferase domain-containing protein
VDPTTPTCSPNSIERAPRRRPDAHRRRRRPDPSVGSKPVRIAVDYGDAAELAGKLDKAITAISTGNDALFRMLRQQGVFVGRGAAPKVAFLYTGQGSQYVNMLAGLRATEPIVADVFRQADDVMTPLLGRPLDVVHLHRRRRPAGRQRSRTATAADRDHPAGGARNRSGHQPTPGHLRHASRHGHGPQPR